MNEPERTSRGRPRAFDRRTALEAALGLFWRHGYDATSLAELTAEMGITPPSLYAAFGSKKELFLEAVELYATTYGSGMAQALAEEPTAKEAVSRLLFDAAAQFSAPAHPYGCFVTLGATNCTSASADVETALRERRALSAAALRTRCQKGIEDGELPADTDAGALARFYGTVVQGMSVQARDGASREELESVVRRALLAWPSAEPKNAPKKTPRRQG